eukprot:SM000171S03258  [mRNA]  locus=s171:210545:212852:- [translate_table: standard]
MRALAASALRPLTPLLGEAATLALAGLAVSNAAFAAAAVLLYKLSVTVLGDEELARTAAALFCLNPASAFFSAIYSESLFAALSFGGLWLYASSLRTRWLAAVLFGLSGLTRSNGVLHAGYILFDGLHAALLRHRPGSQLLRGMLVTTWAQLVLALGPFVGFQVYGYRQFCTATGQVDAAGNYAAVPRPWCHHHLPYLYSFVQSHYWGVGFLRYFQVKQIPNFLSASPAIIFASCAIATYACARPVAFVSLGLVLDPLERSERAVESYSEHCIAADMQAPPAPRRTASLAGALQSPYFSPMALCFTYQLAVMVLVAVFVMHVQVAC